MTIENQTKQDWVNNKDISSVVTMVIDIMKYIRDRQRQWNNILTRVDDNHWLVNVKREYTWGAERILELSIHCNDELKDIAPHLTCEIYTLRVCVYVCVRAVYIYR